MLPAPFGWPGGKRQLKARIIALIPPHKTYVEPCAGAASVFWAKPRSPVEALNDLDADLMRFYEALPKLEHCDVHTLAQDFPGLVAKQGQQQPCEFLAGVACSFGNKRGNYAHSGSQAQLCLRNAPTFHQNLPWYKERLKGVHLHNEDWATTVMRYDAPDTFFYFDPPYHGTARPYQGGSVDVLDRLAELLPSLKGKWLLSYDDHPSVRQAFRQFSKRSVESTYTIAAGNNRLRGRQVFISNFPI